MTKFIIKRLLLSVLILFFVMLLIYTIMYSMPTSYVEKTARELAQRPGSLKSAEQWLAELNAQYGMDRGILGGYFHWIRHSLFTGDFGESWYWTVNVTEKFQDSVWTSFSLGAIAFVLQIFIAIPLGVIAARKQYSITDYSVTVISMICISMPTFFVATLLKLIFSVKLGWLDISGMQSRDYLNLSAFGQFMDRAEHLIMPAMTLTIIGIGSLMRYTRTNMLEVLNADYIRTARAKGLPESKVINYHAFRNTLIPIVTILGNSLPGLFAGALITETLFSIRGLGFASYYSMISGDIPFMMFYLMFISSLTLLGNLLADILYAVVDPRVRLS